MFACTPATLSQDTKESKKARERELTPPPALELRSGRHTWADGVRLGQIIQFLGAEAEPAETAPGPLLDPLLPLNGSSSGSSSRSSSSGQGAPPPRPQTQAAVGSALMHYGTIPVALRLGAAAVPAAGSGRERERGSPGRVEAWREATGRIQLVAVVS